jgi:hypothetical protein
VDKRPLKGQSIADQIVIRLDEAEDDLGINIL